MITKSVNGVCAGGSRQSPHIQISVQSLGAKITAISCGDNAIVVAEALPRENMRMCADVKSLRWSARDGLRLSWLQPFRHGIRWTNKSAMMRRSRVLKVSNSSRTRERQTTPLAPADELGPIEFSPRDKSETIVMPWHPITETISSFPSGTRANRWGCQSRGCPPNGEDPPSARALPLLDGVTD